MTSERHVERAGAEPVGELYRIQHPTLRVVLGDLTIPSGDPGPGDMVPTFDLPTTDGGRIDNEELRRDGRPMLLVFGSLTCPVTESAGDGLRELHTRYGDRVRFVLVNMREAHPGAAPPQPGTFAEKFEHALALREHHRLPFEVAVDDIDGALHRQFGPRPSSAYIVAPSGEILFRAHWSNVTDAIDGALAAVTAGTTPSRPDVAHTARAMATMTGHADTAFAAAGRGAWSDTWKAAPPFAAMIGVSRLFGFLRPSRRGLPTMVTMAAIVTAVVVAVVMLIV
ncbi:hypothetical protein BH23ACT3_BH23ACT3_05070 [soil metagenome]